MVNRKHTILIICSVIAGIFGSVDLPLHAQEGEPLFDYAQALMRFEEKKLYDMTVDALKSYLAKYPESENAADVQFSLGRIHEDNKKRDQAFTAYLKIVTLYPASEHVSASKVRAGGVITTDSRLSPIKEKLHSFLESPVSGGNYTDTYAQYIQSLRDLIYPKLNDAIIAECRLFAESFPEDSRTPSILEAVGDMEEENGRSWEALTTYLRVLHFHGVGNHVVSCLVKVADLFAGSLKRYEDAVGTYERILASSSDTSITGQVQWKLAHVLSDQLDNHSRAVQEYQNLVDRFPDSEYAVDALMSKAEIHVTHLKQYEAAVSAYRMLAEKYPEHAQAPEAMAKAGEVYDKSMEDLESAIRLYEELAERYSTLPLAGAKLYEAAEIAERRIKDTDRALQLYEKVADQFASEKVGDRARRKVEAIQKQKEKE